ncbi:MAG: glycosyltransferase family 4 protein [Patescibacteria group bacterium]|jgi:glycosyltransferase involved in cell wall biosynthesis
MKVVHVSCVAPPQGGGIGVVANQEVLCLRKLGVDATLVAPRSTYHVSRTTYHVVSLPALRIGNVGRLLGLKKVLKDADVVHLHYPFYFTAGMIARWRRQNKIKHLVVTLHHDATDDGWRGLVANLHRKFLQKRVLNSADLLLVSTLDYARNSSYSSFVGDPRLHELPFGVDTELFCPIVPVPVSPSSVILADAGIQYDEINPIGSPGLRRTSPEDDKKNKSVIGTVSVMDRAHPFKGIDVFLRAVAKLPANVHAVVVGDGDRRQSYEELAKELGIAERVNFAGRLGEDDLIKTLQNLDVFVFPSTSSAEAFGLVALEAMSCGVPVVASDLPGVREVVKNAGVTVGVNDEVALAKAVEDLLNDTDRRQTFAKAAREKALGMDWNKHAQTLLDYYKQL